MVVMRTKGTVGRLVFTAHMVEGGTVRLLREILVAITRGHPVMVQVGAGGATIQEVAKLPPAPPLAMAARAIRLP